MAMTKKERSEFEALLLKYQTIAALRWTERVDEDVMPPSHGAAFGVLSVGFCANKYALRVEPACSSSISHGIGSTTQTSSQNPKKLFSTELLALKAMRHQIELECAAKLLKVDKMIEEHEATQ
jgi:hypothetical protein